MSVIEYTVGERPAESGVYACRVQSDVGPSWLEDKFLLWDGQSWWHLRSSIQYRDDVIGWIGPLQRRLGEGGAA